MKPEIKAIFLDAAGTLMQVASPVGITYQRLCAAQGLLGTEAAFEQGFRQAWKHHAPPFHPARKRSTDDDKGWWHRLFTHAVHHAVPDAVHSQQAIDYAFEAAYAFYGTGAAWSLYPEVKDCLHHLAAHCPLRVLSNFDRRLHGILRDLDIHHYFQDVILSSEVGASKPHGRMFEAALSTSGAKAHECLHIGDEEDADGHGARAAGFQVLILKRPEITLEHAVHLLRSATD